MSEMKTEGLYVALSEMLEGIEDNPSMHETELKNTHLTKIIEMLGWPEGSVETEKGLKLGTTNHRADYVLSYRTKPEVIIEVKRPEVSLSDGAEEQLADYLYKVKAKIGIAFNGQALEIIDGNGKHLDTWSFDRNKSIPKNVKELINIFDKFLVYENVTKKDYSNYKKEEIEKEESEDEEPKGEAAEEIISSSSQKTDKQTDPIVILIAIIIGVIIIAIYPVILLLGIIGLIIYFILKQSEKKQKQPEFIIQQLKDSGLYKYAKLFYDKYGDSYEEHIKELREYLERHNLKLDEDKIRTVLLYLDTKRKEEEHYNVLYEKIKKVINRKKPAEGVELEGYIDSFAEAFEEDIREGENVYESSYSTELIPAFRTILKEEKKIHIPEIELDKEVRKAYKTLMDKRFERKLKGKKVSE